MIAKLVISCDQTTITSSLRDCSGIKLIGLRGLTLYKDKVLTCIESLKQSDKPSLDVAVLKVKLANRTLTIWLMTILKLPIIWSIKKPKLSMALSQL